MKIFFSFSQLFLHFSIFLCVRGPLLHSRPPITPALCRAGLIFFPQAQLYLAVLPARRVGVLVVRLPGSLCCRGTHASQRVLAARHPWRHLDGELADSVEVNVHSEIDINVYMYIFIFFGILCSVPV